MVWYFPQIDNIVLARYQISMFWITAILAIIVGAFLLNYFLSKEKQKTKHIIGAIVVILLGAFIGARLFFAFGPWTWELDWTLSERLDFFFSMDLAGIVFYGGFFGAFCALLIYTHFAKLKKTLYLDAVALAYLPAHIVARLGCLFVNDHPEKATSLPWGVIRYQTAEMIKRGVASASETWTALRAVHPSLIYYIILLIPICFLIYYIYFKKQYSQGAIFLAGVLSYSIMRFWNEFYREYLWYFLGLTASQWISLALIITCAAIIYKKRMLIFHHI